MTVLNEAPMYIDDTPQDAGIALRDAPTLRDIQRVQAIVGLYPQVHLEPKHHFATGMYGRELFMPAGTLIVGKIHKHQHLAIMVYGDILVYTEQEGRKRYTGYNMMVSPPETKRIVYPLKDTLWVTIHASDERDLEKLESQLITPDDQEAISALAQEFIDQVRRIEA